MTLVIDLSHHNIVPETLVRAKEAGVSGVIHKATEGVTFTDPKLKARHHLAKQAGLLWGVYHFLRPGNMQEQVDYFVKQAWPTIDEKTLFAADYEDPKVGLEDLYVFMKELEQQTNSRPILYSGHVLREKMAKQPLNELTQYRLWFAQYGSGPDLPNGWNQYFLWQYTDKGEVPGITPPTDMNNYQYSASDLEVEWAEPIGEFEEPEELAPKIVRVIAPPGVEVIVEYPEET